MKKAVLKLNLHDDKSKNKAMKIVYGLSVIRRLTCLALHETGDSRTNVSKKKAMKIVSGLSGVDSISMDMKDQKLTVIGDIDPVDVVRKLRNVCHTEIVSVGPAKEPEKKKEEPKKEEEQKKKEDAVVEWFKAYQGYNPQTTHYYVRSAEEGPNSCVIC